MSTLQDTFILSLPPVSGFCSPRPLALVHYTQKHPPPPLHPQPLTQVPPHPHPPRLASFHPFMPSSPLVLATAARLITDRVYDPHRSHRAPTGFGRGKNETASYLSAGCSAAKSEDGAGIAARAFPSSSDVRSMVRRRKEEMSSSVTFGLAEMSSGHVDSF